MIELPFWEIVGIRDEFGLSVRRQEAAPYNIELAVLAALAKNLEVRRVLDIGTGGGTTAELFAKAGCEVTTIGICNEDLDCVTLPDKEIAFVPTFSEWKDVALRLGKLGARTIRADTMALDFSTLGEFDLAFVDGCHGAEFVANDSHKAWNVLVDGGVMIWHDYDACWDGRMFWPGVKGFLDGFNGRHPFIKIMGTSMVMLEKQPWVVL